MADNQPIGVPEEDTAVQPSPLVAPLAGNMLMGLLNIPKHLMDASKESFDHTYGPGPATMSTDDPPWKDPLPAAATNVAMMLVGGGAPAAEAGAAGIFGGKLARTADIPALIEANKMAKMGEEPVKIWGDTGWMKSPVDNKWKFEIPDNASAMNRTGRPDYSRDGDFYSGPASNLFNHSELYKAYPQLQDMKMYNTVMHNPANGIGVGSFNPAGKGIIEASAPDLGNARSVALHELQHGVQSIENFARGGNPSSMAYLKEQLPEKLPPHEQQTEPYDLYHRLGGEVEARNTQNRMDFEPLHRQMIPPWETHDTLYRNQLAYDPRYNFVRALKQLK